ncbi:MAG: hypothetical protein JSW07_07050 [bacterium]|nr:MAG: hypothetical protein JSW07_07050 [bacterium]
MNKKCIALAPIWLKGASKPCEVGAIIELPEKDYKRKLSQGMVKPYEEKSKQPLEQPEISNLGKTNVRSKKN